MKHRTLYIILIATVFLVACSRKPSYVASEGKMVDVLYDIQLAQSIFRINTAFVSDDKKDAVIAGILEKHDMTQAELDSSLVWYSDNISDYITINDSVASRLRASYDKLSAIRSGVILNARDWSKYIIPPFFYLTESSPLFSFTIDSTKIKEIDSKIFNVSFDVLGINKAQDVEAGIYFNYKDTVVVNIVPINKDTQVILKKPELPDSLLRGVSGYVLLNNKMKNVSSKVLLYNISYSDSLSLGVDDSTVDLRRESEAKPVIDSRVHPRLQKERDTLKMEPERKKSTPKMDDEDTPIISRDKIRKNPMIKREPR